MLIRFLLVSGLMAIASAAIHRQCLFPNFVTNNTADGLTGCVCPDHMEYDDTYGTCFINQCKQVCGEMNCHIRKSNINNFQYFCTCDANYVPITRDMNIGCTPFEESTGFREAAQRLPRNPMFLKRLGCAHTYELVNGKYRCACFEGYTLNEATGQCMPSRRCSTTCGQNQICTVNKQNVESCVCKAGETFGLRLYLNESFDQLENLKTKRLTFCFHKKDFPVLIVQIISATTRVLRWWNGPTWIFRSVRLAAWPAVRWMAKRTTSNVTAVSV